VSHSTPHPVHERVCQPGMWDAGPEGEGGGTRSDWLGENPPYTPRAARSVRSRTKCPRVQTLDRLSGSITAGMKERKGMAPADCSAVPAPEPCALVPKSRKEESARAGKDARGMGFS
jgi:hypothetical protein